MSWLVDYVKEKEGFRNNAYKDIVGVVTIGYGFTHGVKLGDTITRKAADERLKDELQSYLNNVINYGEANGYEWNSNQIGALTSFSFNLGKGSIKQVTQNGTRDNETIATKMRLYDKAGGKKVRGLTIRRNEEADHFLA